MELTPQGADGIDIAAPRQLVWGLLVDATQLAGWAPMVRGTTAERETLDSARIVEVQLGRRRGRLGVRCTVFEPERRIGWRVERDTFGWWRKFDRLDIEFDLQPAGDGRTRLVGSTHFRPRTLLARATRVLLEPRVRVARRNALIRLRNLAECAAQCGESQTADCLCRGRGSAARVVA